MVGIKQAINSINASLYRFLRDNIYTKNDSVTSTTNPIMYNKNQNQDDSNCSNSNHSNGNNDKNDYLNINYMGKKPLYQTDTKINTNINSNKSLINTTDDPTPTHIKSYAAYIVSVSLTFGLILFLISTAAILTYFQKKSRKVIL